MCEPVRLPSALILQSWGEARSFLTFMGTYSLSSALSHLATPHITTLLFSHQVVSDSLRPRKL